MLRRDFVRTAFSFFFATRLARAQQAANPAPPPPAPVPWTLGLNNEIPLPLTVEADTVAESEVRFFSVLQMRTLTRLSDLLMPPLANKPGAVAAQTPQFLDFLIGSSPQPRRTLYTGGLDWLEAQSRSKYRKPFAEISDSEAGALVSPWLRTWMTDHPPTEAHADFINIAQDDIRQATVNSPAWDETVSLGADPETEVDLYWSPIEPDLHRRVLEAAIPPHVLAAHQSAHNLPEYSR